MLSPKTLSKLPDGLVSLIDELQQDIIKSIAKKLVKADYLTPSAEWQLYKASQLQLSTKEINALIAKNTGLSKRQIKALYTDACKQAINNDAKIYRAYGKDASSFFRSVAFSNTLKAGIKNANGMVSNLTKSMVQSSRGTVTHLMDKAYLKVASGAFSYQEAIYDAVSELASKGIQAVTYKSGRTDWADVAVRRAVLTGIGQTAGQMQLDLAEEMDCDLVEVTAHMGARPSHALWQGKVYSISGNHKKYSKLATATGYGTGAGLKGWNCRHDFYPFFEGISERANLPVDAEENAKEYELSQQQRGMERSIRKSKRSLAALDGAIKSTDDPLLKQKLQNKFDRTSASLKVKEQKLTDFCSENGLYKKNDRVRVAGFNKSVSQKAVHANKRRIRKNNIDNSKKPAKLKDNINNKTSKSSYKNAVNDRSVDNVQDINVSELTEEQNIKLNEANKKLLEKIKDKDSGTEALAIYDLDMEQIILDGDGYVYGKNGRVSLPNPQMGHIVIHNHPSGSTFGIDDIRRFADHDNIVGLGAIGNNGKGYFISKSDDFDGIGFTNLIDEKCNNDIIFNGKTYNELLKLDGNSLMDLQKQEFSEQVNTFFEGVLKDGEKYGVKYTK